MALNFQVINEHLYLQTHEPTENAYDYTYLTLYSRNRCYFEIKYRKDSDRPH